MDKIKVVVVEPYKKPYEKEIENSLKAIQQEVGGAIEYVDLAPYDVQPKYGMISYRDAGHFRKTPNRCIYEDEKVVQILFGTFLAVGLENDGFVSLTTESKEEVMNLFLTPELIEFSDAGISVLPIDEHMVRYEVLQIDGNKYMDLKFCSFSFLKSENITPSNQHYKKVYTGYAHELDALETLDPLCADPGYLERLYIRFNTNIPGDYKGHSMSVSDVVSIYYRNEKCAYFVDSKGFVKLPDFWK